MSGTLTIQGAVTVNIGAITQTTVLADSGTIEPALAIDGMLTGATAAAKAEQHRQLTELVWYGRHAGGVYISASNLAIVNGLYEMDYEGSWPRTGFPRARLTLRRLGGSPLGGNIVQRLRAASSLQANSYSITSTPRIALPIGAVELSTPSIATRVASEGSVKMLGGSGEFAFSGADYLKGECRIWDTTGSAVEADWLRVWSPDHVFAATSHLVIENGLLRITAVTTTNLSSHRYWVWTGAAYTEVSGNTGGDFTWANSQITSAPSRMLIDDLTPWRVRVSFVTLHGANFITKTLTLERGKPLAQVELAATSSTQLAIGLVGTTAARWVFTKGVPLSGGDMQRAAFDDTEEAGDAAFPTPDDNWLAMFTTKSSATGALGIVAWQSSALTSYSAREGGGGYVSLNSATTLNAYIGGVKYDTSSAQLEAEAGTLTAGADLVATIAGASGAGNDQVRLDANGAQVDMATNLASIGGSTVLILFRLAVDGTAAISVNMTIRNTTAGNDLTTLITDETQFAAINTWYWRAVVGTGWNGTDTLVARVTMTASPTTTFCYVDQAIVVAIAGSTSLMQVDDVAGQALTETRVMPIAARQVY